jgi:hypothetical protein
MKMNPIKLKRANKYPEAFTQNKYSAEFNGFTKQLPVSRQAREVADLRLVADPGRAHFDTFVLVDTA